ncbi:MAG: hypothetical protein Hyperionvirus8_54 [Hyperionvirus sp.]|uniref:Uncharacterized protein n=1 Tax=Hyperionvirus sp. TaxID=2487770 RepID=A0A3G5A8G8_9VIRU|nr:MAG: hypothetical protein Hyperionvirus8_54 [Hyperionvirus sp.]
MTSLFVDIKLEPKRVSIDDLISYVKKNVKTMNHVVGGSQQQENEIAEVDVVSSAAGASGIIKAVSKFPQNLNKIFSKFDLFRVGTTPFVKIGKNKCNISLLSAVLSCLKDDFVIMPQDGGGQQIYINQLNTNLVGFINSDKYNELNYRKITGLSQNEIIHQLRAWENSKCSMKVIADYFDVNIFLLDIGGDKLFDVNCYNQFKKSILIMMLSGDDYVFEALFCSGIKIFDRNDHLMKHLGGIVCCKLLENNVGDIVGGGVIVSKAPSKVKESYSLGEKRLLRLLQKEERREEYLKEGSPDLVKIKEEPLENNVDGINEIMECSEVNEDELVIGDISDEEVDMMPDLLANIEKLKGYDQLVLQKLGNKKYDEKKMLLAEIQEDAEFLGISLIVGGSTKKKKTKNQLIGEITNAIKSLKKL